MLWVLLFLKGDFEAVRRCTFDVKALLPQADAHVRQWLAYYAGLPTQDVSGLVAATGAAG